MAQAEPVVSVTTERDETQSVSVEWPVYGALVLALIVAALLGSSRLVDLAQRQPYGHTRESLVILATELHGVAQAIGFDRPAAWVDMALGRGEFSSDLGLASAPPPLAAPVAIAPVAPTATSAPPSPTTLPTVTTSSPTPAPATGTPAILAQSGVLAATATPVPLAPTVTAAATRVAPVAGATPKTPRVAPAAGREPVRVLVIGDSNAEWVGYDLAAYGLRDGTVSSKLDFRLSSGLAVPEFFNWPARLQQQMAVNPPPEAVVIFLGGNDTKNLLTPNGVVLARSPEWIDEYGRRVGQMMDIAGARGARIYWVGMPIMREEWRSAAVSDMNKAAQIAVAERKNGYFVDIWELFSDNQGRFATYLPDYRGEMAHVRQNDGVHLTRVGTTWVSLVVYDQILRDFGWRK